jgi:hypothetical protein
VSKHHQRSPRSVSLPSRLWLSKLFRCWSKGAVGELWLRHVTIVHRQSHKQTLPRGAQYISVDQTSEMYPVEGA